MANSGSAPNCAYGGNAGTPAWNSPAAGPFIYSDSGIYTGLTFGGSSVSFASIADGTSNTAAFSERVKASDRISRRHRRRLTEEGPRLRWLSLLLPFQTRRKGSRSPSINCA